MLFARDREAVPDEPTRVTIIPLCKHFVFLMRKSQKEILVTVFFLMSYSA